MKDQDLQLMMARKLVEKIGFFGRTAYWMQDYTGKFIENGAREIRPTEWLEIVRMVEEKLDINQLTPYADALDKVCVPIHICALTHWQAVIMSSWQQRATALHEIGVLV
jgi:hypothetical protein